MIEKVLSAIAFTTFTCPRTGVKSLARRKYNAIPIKLVITGRTTFSYPPIITTKYEEAFLFTNM